LLSFSLLLLPRLGLWSRDKAAKGIADVATVVAGRIDVATIEDEAVGAARTRVGSRGPINTALASAVELISAVRIDIPAPHKEQWITSK
ncbi:MAG: hypothetical protein K1W07_08955, partial [Parabacteroides distasonis]